MRIFFRDNSTIIEIGPIEDDAGGIVANATASATLTSGDDAVPGIADPVPLIHQAAGIYSGVVPPILLKDGALLNVEIRAEISGVVGTRSETMVMKNRSFNPIQGR